RSYLEGLWPTLMLTMADGPALLARGRPPRWVLYVPAEFPISELNPVIEHCHIEVHPLPQVIRQLGDVDPTRLPVQGLLYLPHPYVVPGGFFNEMYGWDSYFIVLGLLADHRSALARDMVENALFEVEQYGAVLNANRTYFLSRSQPPLLSAMISALLADPASFPSDTARQAWLAEAYPLAVRN